jgi:putative ABC transport system substrate-binding protein
VGWPLAARAQRPAISVIGFLDTGSVETTRENVAAFREGLKEAGYVEGKNVTIEFRLGANNGLSAMAADLVRRKVDVIVASGGFGSTLAAMTATSTIPIVITGGADPVKYGWVASMNRPSSNVTGVTQLHNELAGKRLDFLIRLVPQAMRIGYLVGYQQDNETEQSNTAELLAAARALARQVIVLECRSMADLEAAFVTLAERQVEGLIVSAFPMAFNNRNKITTLAAHYKIPAIYSQSQYAYSGGLMSYSATGTMKLAAIQYVARILKGDKPADLPVQQPSQFEFIINLKTATALGVEVPRAVLAAANKVIE